MFNFFKKPKETTKKPVKKDAVKKTAPRNKQNNKPKNKNISRKVRIGTTLQTRDEFFEGRKSYQKPGYENAKNYRKAVVIDSNLNDELAVVKLTTADNAKPLPNYQKGKSKFKPFIETKDDNFQPIKIGEKFERNSKKQKMSKRDVNTIKKESLIGASKSLNKANRKKLRDLKGRK